MTSPKTKTPRTKKTTSRVGSGTKLQKKEDQLELYLTANEMAKMSEFSYEARILKLKAEKSVMEEEKLILQIQKMQVDLELQKVKSSSMVTQMQGHKSKTQQYVDTIKIKYNIQADKFSYHPETGKLLLEDLT